MGKRAMFLTIGLLITLLGLSPAPAQEAPPPPVAIPAERAHPKLETILQLLAERRQEGVVVAQAFAQAQGIQLADDAVRVVLEPLGERIDRAALELLGATVEATSRSLIRARLPLPQIVAVADSVSGIRFIRRPYRPRAVAVIDLGFSGLSNAIANGEFVAATAEVRPSTAPAPLITPARGWRRARTMGRRWLTHGSPGQALLDEGRFRPGEC